MTTVLSIVLSNSLGAAVRALVAGASGSLVRRLVMIEQGNGNRNLGTTGIIFVCAAAVLLPLAPSRAQQRDATARATRQPATTQQAEENVDPVLQKTLDRQLPELQFGGVGFSDVVDFLRDVSGANIFVNWKSLEEAGIDRNTPLTAKLRNIKFSKALNVLLDSAGGGSGRLVWKTDGNVLVISALGAGAKVIQRSYDVHDLAPDAGKGDSLIRMITGSIDVDSWKDNGGKTGTIKMENGKLVVTQTESNQKSIANLLARTRELVKTGH